MIPDPTRRSSTVTTDTPPVARPHASTETDRSARHVVEHALVAYGYSPHVARALVDQLLAEVAS